VTATGAGSTLAFIVIGNVWIPYERTDSVDDVVNRVKTHYASGPWIPTHLAHMLFKES
jgi:hypothetical protein